MNKILKKFSVAFLTATYLFLQGPCNYVAFANTTDNAYVSDEALNSLPETLRNMLIENNEEIVSITTEYYNLNSNSKTNINNARAVMPKSDFNLTVVVSRAIKFDDDGYDTFRITACGEWIDNPVYEFTDCIGIAWSDDFTLESDYAWVEYDDFNDLSSVCRLNDVVPEAGVAYDIDLRTGMRERYVYATATVYAEDSHGTANVVATYGHVILRASSVDVSFGGGASGPEVGMSVGFGSGIKKAMPAYDSFEY